jgi:hypothetical protein
MERLDAELRRELDRFGPSEGGTAAISHAWAVSVGETVARNAWPTRLAEDGTLHVATSSSTWAFELARLAETILEQLRSALGKAAPRTLKFAPGPVPEPRSAALAATIPTRPPVTPEQRAEAAELAAGIGDDELRELVARAAAASLAAAAAEAASDRRF